MTGIYVVKGSQSPENGSQHCKKRHEWRALSLRCGKSQSPENGSQHCKNGSAASGYSPSIEPVAIP